MTPRQRQETLEKLRRSLGTQAVTGCFAPKTGASSAAAVSHSPETILHTGLHEFLGQGPGDWPGVLAFALSAAGRAVRDNGKPVFILSLANASQEWGRIYGHGFPIFGLDPARVIAVTVPHEKELLWATEEAATSRAAGAIITATGAKERLYGFPASRRLKLRAENSGGPVFVLRHWSQEGATAAVSRWRISRLPSIASIKTPGVQILGPPRLRAVMERCQGLPPTLWEMECYASRGFCVASPLENGTSRTAATPAAPIHRVA